MVIVTIFQYILSKYTFNGFSNCAPFIRESHSSRVALSPIRFSVPVTRLPNPGMTKRPSTTVSPLGGKAIMSTTTATTTTHLPGGPAVVGGRPGVVVGQPGVVGGRPGVVDGQPGVVGGQPGVVAPGPSRTGLYPCCCPANSVLDVSLVTLFH